MNTLAVFNSKTTGGKSSLVYHLAHMYAYLGIRVLAVDLDPQAELTSMFLDEDRLEEIWAEGEHTATIHGAIQPSVAEMGEVRQPNVEHVGERLFLIPGDLALASLEDPLSARGSNASTVSRAPFT
ncbi:MAG: AAA family ATPase [Thermoanaerobaculia bacterium]|nr:AAA family ATPase [Thermoanaerobaculia bacterium]